MAWDATPRKLEKLIQPGTEDPEELAEAEAAAKVLSEGAEGEEGEEEGEEGQALIARAMLERANRALRDDARWDDGTWGVDVVEWNRSGTLQVPLGL